MELRGGWDHSESERLGAPVMRSNVSATESAAVSAQLGWISKAYATLLLSIM